MQGRAAQAQQSAQDNAQSGRSNSLVNKEAYFNMSQVPIAGRRILFPATYFLLLTCLQSFTSTRGRANGWDGLR
jgi:hypothetical protein